LNTDLKGHRGLREKGGFRRLWDWDKVAQINAAWGGFIGVYGVGFRLVRSRHSGWFFLDSAGMGGNMGVDNGAVSEHLKIGSMILTGVFVTEVPGKCVPDTSGSPVKKIRRYANGGIV